MLLQLMLLQLMLLQLMLLQLLLLQLLLLQLLLLQPLLLQLLLLQPLLLQPLLLQLLLLQLLSKKVERTLSMPMVQLLQCMMINTSTQSQDNSLEVLLNSAESQKIQPDRSRRARADVVPF